MPCYRCGARQDDPERGPSPWKRGVVREHQVLICPSCQRGDAWRAELQTCPSCHSPHLIRRLDQVECLDCRLVRDAADAADAFGEPGLRPASPGPAGAGGDPQLAAEVARALSRVLRPVSGDA